MTSPSYPSCFQRVFDVVVVGSGLAGLAGALRAANQGKSVLLIGPGGHLAWEAGRCLSFTPGQCDAPEWTALIDDLTARSAAREGLIDPAVTEVVATSRLRRAGITPLYYAHPVAAETDGDSISGLIVATKAGLRRVAGRQWIDATETALPARLAGCEPALSKPSSRLAWIFFQAADWSGIDDGLDDENLSLHRTLWPTERALQIRIDPDLEFWRDALIPAIEAMHAAVAGAADRIQISHASWAPLDLYPPGETPQGLPDNVACSCPATSPTGAESLAQRFALGLSAADALADRAAGAVSPSALEAAIPPVQPVRTESVDVFVAGAGTGGALAAIAAGREYLSEPGHVLCADVLNFPGGIGAGGGINGYYYGVPGGLQEEVDARVVELHERFGRFFEVRPRFHPLAKLLVLEEMIRQAGARLQYESLLGNVEADGEGTVRSALLAGPEGPVRVEATSWLDATGDGDLCIQAGASARLGRDEDGLLHTFSQSAGMLQQDKQGRIGCRVVNFDADWCDPTDPEDLTRGRVGAIEQYLQETYENFTRPTYIAPAIGLRQGAQIETDYVVTFDDTIRNARFPDAVGLAGSWYDNHSVDFEQESDEAVFWMWVARCYRTPTGCQIPYRALIPRQLRNVWIASRCLGVTIDAHHMLRMQRDMQRIGEASAVAAALAAQRNLPAREVPCEDLRARLEKTDSLRVPQRQDESEFHRSVDPAVLRRREDENTLAQAVEKLRQGVGGRETWLLYVNREKVETEVLTLLDSSDDLVSWLSAALLAMWRQPAAEARLIRAIETLEYGHDERTAEWMHHVFPNETADPMSMKKLVPNWLSAVVLLRRCGTDACLDALGGLARRERLSLNARAAIALTLARLTEAGKLSQSDRVSRILDSLEVGEVALRQGPPQRLVGGAAELSVRGRPDELPHGQRNFPFSVNISHDYTWQLDLAIARTRGALGDDLGRYEAYLADPRRFVRRGFEKVLQRAHR